MATNNTGNWAIRHEPIMRFIQHTHTHTNEPFIDYNVMLASGLGISCCTILCFVEKLKID